MQFTSAPVVELSTTVLFRTTFTQTVISIPSSYEIHVISLLDSVFVIHWNLYSGDTLRTKESVRLG